MTPGARSSISNGIWLCSNCATNIDVDPLAYPKSLLHEWKVRAERTADAEKGRPQPRAEDARAELVGALTGTTPEFTRTAIQNAHGAVQQVLHALDARLSVETSYINGTTKYTLRAREQVDFGMTIPAPLIQEWSAGLQDLLDHGREVKLTATGVQMTGSPLLEKLIDTSGEGAQIVVGGVKRVAVLKVRLVSPDTSLTEQFDDINGGVLFGRKSITFDGSSCGGVLIISFTVQTNQAGAEPTFNLAVDFSSWDGLDVQRLPYFERLKGFVRRLRAGWRIDVGLEIDGQLMLRGSASLPLASETLTSAEGALEYISMLRSIAAFLRAPISFVYGHSISREEFLQAAEVAQTIDGKRVFGRTDMSSRATATVVAKGGNIRKLLSIGGPDSFLVHIDPERELDAFGQTVTLTKRETQLRGVRPELIHADHDLSAIKDGDCVPIKFEPTESFNCSLRYLRPDETPLLGCKAAL